MYEFRKMTPGHGSMTQLWKNGRLFFESPIANSCHGSLDIGIVMPNNDDRCGPWHVNTEIVVAGGNCCHGFVMAITPESRVEKILEVDFNVCFLVPIILQADFVGLLISGQGCDGKGVRYIDFNDAAPIAVPIVSTEEADSVLVPGAWFHWHPFHLDDLWQRLERHGIRANREKSIAALKEYRLIDQRYRGSSRSPMTRYPRD